MLQSEHLLARGIGVETKNIIAAWKWINLYRTSTMSTGKHRLIIMDVLSSIPRFIYDLWGESNF